MFVANKEEVPPPARFYITYCFISKSHIPGGTPALFATTMGSDPLFATKFLGFTNFLEIAVCFSEYFAKFSISKARSLFFADFSALCTEFCHEILNLVKKYWNLLTTNFLIIRAKLKGFFKMFSARAPLEW